MASSNVAETERVIRAKLEASGQYGKMRAMIMEAALQTVTAASSGSPAELSFHPTPALTQATDAGAVELELVQEYLQYLGLQYTARVLQLEAGLPEAPPRTSTALQQALRLPPGDGPCLSAIVRAGGAGLATPAAPAAGVAASPTASASGTGAPAKAAGQTHSTAGAGAAGDDSDDGASEAEGTDASDNDSAASDHNQPGGQDTTYFISKWKRRHFVRHNQVSGQQVQVEYLTECHTVVLDELDSMTVDDCDGGELVIAACEGSVFLRNCKNMTVHVACKQLRTRDCEHIKLHIFTTTDPVVEMSHHVEFLPFNLRLPGLQRLFADARLDPKSNRFVHVYDFTPSEPQLPTPHFEVRFPNHGLSMESRYATYGVPECPPEIEALLALQLMPAASSESGKNKSYDIRTGAQVWAQAGAVPVPVVAATAAAAASPAAAQAQSSDDEEDEDVDDEETASDFDGDDDDDADDASSSASSSTASNNKQQQQQQQTALPIPTPTPTAVAASTAASAPAHAATQGGIDNEDYSSFDDDDDDEDDADDKYDVDEDEDDF